MKRQLFWMTVAIGALGASVAGAQVFSSPPDYRYGTNNDYGQTVRCESNDSRTERCRIRDAGEVRLARQLSRTQCIQGRNWDYSRDEIRVTDGCRADFVVIRRDDGRYGRDDRRGNGYGRDQVVRCEPRSQGRTYCGNASDDYTMVGQRNGNCIQGRTYGQDSRGLWVAGNCSAQFRRVHDRDDRNGNGRDDYAQTIRCSGNSSGRTYCADADARYTLRDTSNRYCVEGRTWGTDQRGLWVSNACNAEFIRRPYTDTYPTGAYGERPYYEREGQRD
jgi:hypothetical protein